MKTSIKLLRMSRKIEKLQEEYDKLAHQLYKEGLTPSDEKYMESAQPVVNRGALND